VSMLLQMRLWLWGRGGVYPWVWEGGGACRRWRGVVVVGGGGGGVAPSLGPGWPDLGPAGPVWRPVGRVLGRPGRSAARSTGFLNRLVVSLTCS
jgi:hypothetical protein